MESIGEATLLFIFYPTEHNLNFDPTDMYISVYQLSPNSVTHKEINENWVCFFLGTEKNRFF